MRHYIRINPDNTEVTVDSAGEEDTRVTTAVVLTLRDRHPEWLVGSGVGFTYNGKSIVYTSEPLPLPSRDETGQPHISEVVRLRNLDGSDSRRAFRVTLTLVGTVHLPEPTMQAWRDASGDEVSQSVAVDWLAFLGR